MTKDGAAGPEEAGGPRREHGTTAAGGPRSGTAGGPDGRWAPGTQVLWRYRENGGARLHIVRPVTVVRDDPELLAVWMAPGTECVRPVLADRTVDGIVADRERAREYAESSPSVVTPLNKYIGYEEAAKVAKKALAQRSTIRQVVLEGGYVERGDLTVEQLDEALDVLRMTRP